MPGPQDGSHSHRQRLARYMRGIPAKQRGVVTQRHVVQRDAMRARDQLVAGLVEADMPVGADAEQLQVDAPGVVDRRLVALALLVRVGSNAIEKMDSRAIDAD